jgi:hypothetical protein
LLEKHYPLPPPPAPVTDPGADNSGEGDAAKGGDNGDAVLAVAAAGDTSPLDGDGSEEGAASVPSPPQPKIAPWVMDREAFLRVKLGALVHRKMAIMGPEIARLSDGLPEKWRLLLSEALSNVTLTLNESFAKMRRRLGDADKVCYLLLVAVAYV